MGRSTMIRRRKCRDEKVRRRKCAESRDEKVRPKLWRWLYTRYKLIQRTTSDPTNHAFRNRGSETGEATAKWLYWHPQYITGIL